MILRFRMCDLSYTFKEKLELDWVCTITYDFSWVLRKIKKLKCYGKYCFNFSLSWENRLDPLRSPVVFRHVLNHSFTHTFKLFYVQFWKPSNNTFLRFPKKYSLSHSITHPVSLLFFIHSFIFLFVKCVCVAFYLSDNKKSEKKRMKNREMKSNYETIVNPLT